MSADVLGLAGHERIALENNACRSASRSTPTPTSSSASWSISAATPCRPSTATTDAALVRRLTVGARARSGSVVTIRVADTGPGVPDKARAHLFQAFQGAARPGGTGLGLAIAAEIVRAHGGAIALVDQAGPGAIFEIVIPDRNGGVRRTDGRATAPRRGLCDGPRLAFARRRFISYGPPPAARSCGPSVGKRP